MRAFLCFLCLSLGVHAAPSFQVQNIKNTIYQMALYQAKVRHNISTLNNRLSIIVLDIRARRVQMDDISSARVLEVFRENTALFRILQDYYGHNDGLFNYLEGILEGYKSIARDMQHTAPLQDCMPIMRDILTQLQAIVMLEKQLDNLIEQ
ncbi:hypothetical protein [Helicobacter cynogastricus]|uniref:hypothetical protein n=1 Tax=Helicobacter cynogastricus TaxID=329937 RepID=UPI001315885D|nr:hypothetical protein [Helicobacter cynogastricus]